MSPENIGDFLKEGLFVVIAIVAIVLIPGLIMGLIVATFQAATQINEQTLSFLPRLVITLLCILFFGPWIIGKLVTYSQSLYMNIPYLIN
ncbi:MAG: flagellar biosynthetic protein FliQ [Psychrobacter glaciei]|jgi:flagellar biosynthetic protein FliQ